jgi:ferredoxin
VGLHIPSAFEFTWSSLKRSSKEMKVTILAFLSSHAVLLVLVEGFSLQGQSKSVKTLALPVSTRSWSVEDDWTRLSDADNAAPDSDEIYNQDIARKVAHEMDGDHSNEHHPLSKEDQFIADAVGTVHHHGWFIEPSPGDPALYDTSTEEVTKMSFEDQLGKEIAMLVRCNQFPEELLIREGRALAPLSQESLSDTSQLMKDTGDGTYEQTAFFRQAVSAMFNDHAHFDNLAGIKIMDAIGTAQWLAKSLGEEEQFPISPHDRRVAATISRFSAYGTGYLTEENFQNLYVSAITSALDGSSFKNKQTWKVKQPSIDSIWRDIRNHNILSPVEVERAAQAEAIHAGLRGKAFLDGQVVGGMDECEIIDYEETAKPEWELKSSHELVKLAKDGKTPLWIRDGEFIFIDEESCIGCKQCINVAPDSFFLLEDGRARTFKQRNSPDVAMGVEACPVSCMHPVSFDELKEMEHARDHGDGRNDHRHLGGGRSHTALHVAGIDSDANHKSSWFHYLQNKCYSKSTIMMT